MKHDNLKEEARDGNCTICNKHAILGDMFYQDAEGNNVTSWVCKECMFADMIDSLQKGV